MKQNANLASILARLRDIHDQPVIASTDGGRVRLLIHERHDAHSGWHYTDLAPAAADQLAAALNARSRLQHDRGLTGWFTRLQTRR
ncbi:hypothetical protein ACQPW1_22950 [Nocardia sp. CA-128927]|uniref:hypothetical protein n=1 Tax=Nocardia sp. CA-128927 TaxID=3239975 RepID=UPI003D96A60F